MNKRKFWWLFTGFFVGIMCLLVMAANPSFQNFLTTEFSVTGSGSGQMIQIKDGAQLPGTLNVGTINITNLNAVTGALTVDKSISLTGGTGPGWTETNTASGSQLNFSNTDFQIIPSSLGTPVFDIFQAGPVTISFLGNGGQSLVYGSGNLTITGGAFTGNGSGLTTLNAGNLSSGTVATARLGSGSATSSTFLRGDQTWATPAGGGVTVPLTLQSNITTSATVTILSITNNTPAISGGVQAPSPAFEADAYSSDGAGVSRLMQGTLYVHTFDQTGNNVPLAAWAMAFKTNGVSAGDQNLFYSSGAVSLGFGNFFMNSGGAVTLNGGLVGVSGAFSSTVSGTTISAITQFNGNMAGATNYVDNGGAQTANFSTLSTDSGKAYSNAGAVGAVTNSLPAATFGQRQKMFVVAAQFVAFKANGTDTIRSIGTVSVAGGVIFANTTGAAIEIECPNAGTWYVYSTNGAWTIH